MVLPGLRLMAVSIHMKPGGRGRGGGGRSCAGAAAYRSATRLCDDYLGRDFDYRRKEGVLHRELMGWPVREGETYAEAQQRLWSEVDRSERRRDARTFLDVRFTLPRELTLEQQAAVCRDIAAAIGQRFGIAGDWALHESHQLRGAKYVRHPANNPHAHLGLTTREVDHAGKFRAAKQLKLYTKRTLLWLRRLIARIQNAHLGRLGHQVRVTHRSLAAEYRKVNRRRAAEGLRMLETPEATRHRGLQATHRMRRGEACRIEEENDRVRQWNGSVLESNAKIIALDEQIRTSGEREPVVTVVSTTPDSPAAEDTTRTRHPLPEPGGASAGNANIQPAVHGGLQAAEAVAPADECTFVPTEPGAVAPEDEPMRVSSEPAHSPGELRGLAEERILNLRGQLLRDDQNRSREQQHRSRVEELTRHHCPSGVTRILRKADSPEHWRRLVAQVRERAAEKPSVTTRLMIRLDAGTRREWEQRSRDLNELAGAVEAMWQARKAVLPTEERAGLEREVKEVAGRLRVLNAAEREQRTRARISGQDRPGPSGMDRTGSSLSGRGSQGRGGGGISF